MHQTANGRTVRPGADADVVRRPEAERREELADRPRAGSLQQRADRDSPWAAFLRSWPDEPPPLPKNLDSSQLAEAQDEREGQPAQPVTDFVLEAFLKRHGTREQAEHPWRVVRAVNATRNATRSPPGWPREDARWTT